MEVDPLKVQVLIAIGKLRGSLVALAEFQRRTEEAKDVLILLDMDSQNPHLHKAYQVERAVGVFAPLEKLRILEAIDELKFYLEQL